MSFTLKKLLPPVLAASLLLPSIQAFAKAEAVEDEPPSAIAMVPDLLILRPVGMALTAIGAVVWVVALPLLHQPARLRRPVKYWWFLRPNSHLTDASAVPEPVITRTNNKQTDTVTMLTTETALQARFFYLAVISPIPAIKAQFLSANFLLRASTTSGWTNLETSPLSEPISFTRLVKVGFRSRNLKIF